MIWIKLLGALIIVFAFAIFDVKYQDKVNKDRLNAIKGNRKII